MKPPDYFEEVRANAARRWDQLEADPELAGPWHQLFGQVQRPRHIVSELLQNADDAFATEANVRIDGDEFVFTHNGDDFTNEHFASLCRFAYSNKRTLHTIGFRGIGFKSTFSLGDEVRLLTPTLSVAFRRRRFTEPAWIEHAEPDDRVTTVSVMICDASRRREMEKNLDEWLESPASLLFFHSIRRLRVGEREVQWSAAGPGPVPESQWMVSAAQPDRRYLLLRSPEEEFPPEAVEEIRQERMVVEDDMTFPPCRVELVLDLEGRLFVILPTGVKTDLPFACNAPFLQDPGRLGIKPPETSPTNRWLLDRIGSFAGAAMLNWLLRTDLDQKERARAYGLLPAIGRDNNTLEGVVATTVGAAMKHRLRNERFLLAESAQLEPWSGCTAVPGTLLQVWSPTQVTSTFLKGAGTILSPQISRRDRAILRDDWGCVGELTKQDVLQVLRTLHLPQPSSWRQLLALWDFVAADIRVSEWNASNIDLRIVPVQGTNVLHAAAEVIRIGENKALGSAEDWDFLAQHLSVLSRDWLGFLDEQRRDLDGKRNPALIKVMDAVSGILEALKLNSVTDASKMVDLAAQKLFGAPSVRLEDCVRIAHIGAALGVTVGEGFGFVTRDRNIRHPRAEILADVKADLDLLLPSNWCASSVLHEAYASVTATCPRPKWIEWLCSPKSRVRLFPIPQTASKPIWGDDRVKLELHRRGVVDAYLGRYQSDEYHLCDWDFPQDLWSYWEEQARTDESLWARVLNIVLEQSALLPRSKIDASVSQVCSRGRGAGNKHCIADGLPPEWVMRFRGLPCLRDTWGHYHQPAELLRRTPETEWLFGVEPFVLAEMDTEATRPMLQLLGVRDKPTSPDGLLDRLRVWRGVPDPRVSEIQKWYERLGQMVLRSSTQELDLLRRVFRVEALILTQTGGWATSGEVFLAADEDVAPGVPIVHPAVAHLALWARLGVVDRPSVDLMMAWIKQLPDGPIPAPDILRRVERILTRSPDRVWQECGHWLNLQSQWANIQGLRYVLSKDASVSARDLFPDVRERTADLRMLPAEAGRRPPFSGLRSLGVEIEGRLQEAPHVIGAFEEKAWLVAMGNCLGRVILDAAEETSRVRQLAQRLANTRWQTVAGLEVIPYIDGVPVGLPWRVQVFWRDELLYIESGSTARMARAVAQEFCRAFGLQEIGEALMLCYERPGSFVEEYFMENFRLVDAPVPVAPSEPCERMEASSSVHPDAISPAGPSPPRSGGSSATAASATLETLHGEVGPMRDATAWVPAEGAGSGFTRPSPGSHVAKPGLMDRFTRALGFAEDGGDRYFHSDGRSIRRGDESGFPWEMRSPTGDFLRGYWPKAQCLELRPLEVPAEVWRHCERRPGVYAMVLTDALGEPVEVSAVDLVQWKEQGRLIILPASYRLKLEPDLSAVRPRGPEELRQ